jgi:hypothetical protein
MRPSQWGDAMLSGREKFSPSFSELKGMQYFGIRRRIGALKMFQLLIRAIGRASASREE